MSAKDRGEKKRLLIEVEQEMIEKHERGLWVLELARQYDSSTSTACLINFWNIVKGWQKQSSLDRLLI